MNMKPTILYQVGPFRIIEVLDETYSLDNLKGDCFNPIENPDIDADELKKQELAFEREVDNEGVFGYVLQVWNPEVDAGWEHVDSCFGFVGAFNRESNNHYIFDELLLTLTMKLQARQSEVTPLEALIAIQCELGDGETFVKHSKDAVRKVNQVIKNLRGVN
jgi:hypothetical protein